MEDVTDLLNRIKNQIGGEESLSDEELNRQLNAIYSIYAAAMGPEQLIVQASRFNAVKYIHDENPRSRLIGMERLILESRDYHRQPTDEEIPAILDKLEDKVADILSRQAVERSSRKRSKTVSKSGTRSMSKKSAARSSKRKQAAQRPLRANASWKSWTRWKSQPHHDDPSSRPPAVTF